MKFSIDKSCLELIHYVYQGIGLKLNRKFKMWNGTGKKGSIQIHSVTVE